jgi:uncharacterized protein YjiS (DUF1127 family)
MSSIDKLSAAHAQVDETKNRNPGALRRLITRIFEWRSQSIDRLATVYLQALSDQQLYDLGFSVSEIASLRSGEYASAAPAFNKDRAGPVREHRQFGPQPCNE